MRLSNPPFGGATYAGGDCPRCAGKDAPMLLAVPIEKKPGDTYLPGMHLMVYKERRGQKWEPFELALLRGLDMPNRVACWWFTGSRPKWMTGQVDSRCAGMRHWGVIRLVYNPTLEVWVQSRAVVKRHLVDLRFSR